MEKEKILSCTIIILLCITCGCMEQPQEAPEPTGEQTTQTPSDNTVSVTQEQEDDVNILTFEIKQGKYSIDRINQTEVPNEGLGSEELIPQDFIIDSPAFVEIETDTDYSECEPIIPFIRMKVSLPYASDPYVELTSFNERLISEKAGIAPGIICSGMGSCPDCTGYLSEDSFYPGKIDIYTDINTYETTKDLVIAIPLYRHKPSTRETYILSEAKITVTYRLYEQSRSMLEGKNIPGEIEYMQPFEIDYVATNPTNQELTDLTIRAAIENAYDYPINEIISEEFTLAGGESKTVPLEVPGLAEEEGNYMIDAVLLKGSEQIGQSTSEYIHLSIPVEITVEEPPKNFSLTDTFKTTLINKWNGPLEATVKYSFIDSRDMPLDTVIDYAVWYGGNKTINPNETQTFEINPSFEVLKKCINGCYLYARAKVYHNNRTIASIMPYTDPRFETIEPRHCETDDDCVCCEMIKFDNSTTWRETAVNQYHAERYGCKQTGEFCTVNKAVCVEKQCDMEST